MPTNRLLTHKRIAMIQVNADPTKMSILAPSFSGAAMRGAGDTDYTCPNCSAVLLEGMEVGTVPDVVIRCFNCGTTSTSSHLTGCRAH